MANNSERRRIEQAFIFIQLRFVIKYAIDFKEESIRDEKLKTVEDKIIKFLIQKTISSYQRCKTEYQD